MGLRCKPGSSTGTVNVLSLVSGSPPLRPKAPMLSGMSASVTLVPLYPAMLRGGSLAGLGSGVTDTGWLASCGLDRSRLAPVVANAAPLSVSGKGVCSCWAVFGAAAG